MANAIALIDEGLHDAIRGGLHNRMRPLNRVGPSPPSRPLGLVPQGDPGFSFKPDPEFLEHAHRQRIEQPDLPWEP